MLPIAPDHNRTIQPGNFNVDVNDINLLLPLEIIEALEETAGKRPDVAEQVLSILYTSPTMMARELGWSTEELIAARSGLVEQLKGYVDEDIRIPPPRPSRVYGAMAPRAGH